MDVKIDLKTLEELSRVARTDYGLGGAVQHGASTLPPEAFDAFPQRGRVRDSPRHQLPEHGLRARRSFPRS